MALLCTTVSIAEPMTANVVARAGKLLALSRFDRVPENRAVPELETQSRKRHTKLAYNRINRQTNYRVW